MLKKSVFPMSAVAFTTGMSLLRRLLSNRSAHNSPVYNNTAYSYSLQNNSLLNNSFPNNSFPNKSLQKKWRTKLLMFGIVLVSGGCAAGNFHWYPPPGAETTATGSRYTGESVYADKYLLRKHAQVDNPTLVVVDDSIRIHALDLLSRLEKSYALAKGGTLGWDVATDTLENILLDTLVSLAADTFNLSQDTAGWGDFLTVRNDLLTRLFLTEAVYSQVVVDSLEVDSFYHSRPDIFTYNAQVRVGHIVLSKEGYRAGPDSASYQSMPDGELDSLIMYRLRYLQNEIKDSLMFEEMADKYSQDRRSGDHGGRLGWVERYNLNPEVEDVLYDEKTPLHRAIGPVKSRDGVHLFYLYDRHFKGIPPLNGDRYRQAYEYLLGSRAKVVYAKIRDSLRAAHPTTFNDSILVLSKRQTSPDDPVAWAPGIDTVRFVTFDRASVIVEPNPSRRKQLSLAQLRSVAQGEVDRRLVLMMAEELGLAEKPAFKSEVERQRHKFAEASVHRLAQDPNFRPTEDEVKSYFEEHRSEYVTGKPVRIQQIVFADSVEAEFVRALAESGEDFLELAQKYYPGDTAIRREAADLGYIGPDEFEKNIFERALASKVGEITHPIKTQYGYHIVKVLDVKREFSLEEKRNVVINALDKLHNESVRQKWLAALRSGHNIELEPVRYRGVVMGAFENRSFLPGEVLPPELKNAQL